jgi:hypothetical protein
MGIKKMPNSRFSISNLLFIVLLSLPGIRTTTAELSSAQWVLLCIFTPSISHLPLEFTFGE